MSNLRYDPDLDRLLRTPPPVNHSSVPSLRTLFSDTEIRAAHRKVVAANDEADALAADLIRVMNSKVTFTVAPGTLDILASLSQECAQRVHAYRAAVAAACAAARLPRDL